MIVLPGIRVFLFIVLLLAAYAKVLDTRVSSTRAPMKLPGFFGAYARAVLRTLAFVETLLALGVLLSVVHVPLVAALLLGTYTIYLARTRTPEACMCFGGILEFGGRSGRLARNVLFIVLLAALQLSPGSTNSGLSFEAFLIGGLMFASAVALDRYLALRERLTVVLNHHTGTQGSRLPTRAAMR